MLDKHVRRRLSERRSGRLTRFDDQIARWVLRTLVHAGSATDALREDGALDRPLLRGLGIAPLRDGASTDEVVAQLQQRLAELDTRPRAGTMATENAALVAKLLGLSRTEETVLAFVIGLNSERALRDCYERVSAPSPLHTARVLATILQLPARGVQRALRSDGALRSLPLIEYSGEELFWERSPTLSRAASQVLLRPLLDARDLVKRFLGNVAPCTLTVADYPHVAADVDLLLRILRAALARRTSGVNILIHGPSGTGKTQLAAAMAKQLGASLDAVAHEDEDNDVLTGQDRVERYALGQRLLRGRRNALFIFDEAEDVFPQSATSFFARESGHNKAWTNQLLERNAIPTFWVSNAIGQLDRAFVRRFDYILELGLPPRSVRRRSS